MRRSGVSSGTAAAPTLSARPRTALLVAAVVGLAGFALASSRVELPDLEAAITSLGDTLGAWTYLLVAALAFLEAGAFVGLVAPGETAIVLGGIVAAQGSIDLALIIPVAWLAAALGDFVSFELGRRPGRGFLLRRGPAFGVTASRRRAWSAWSASSPATEPRRS